MKTLSDFIAHLSVMFGRPIGPLNEIKRALTEQTKQFDDEIFERVFERKNAAQTVRKLAVDKIDPDILAGKAGPGGGVKADAFRVAFFTIAASLDGPRATAGEDTWRVWHLPQGGSVMAGWGENFKPKITVCALTGRHLFGDAMRDILSNVDLAKRVTQVRFSSEEGTAEIDYDDGKCSKFMFGFGKQRLTYKVAVLKGAAVQHIAALVRSAERALAKSAKAA
jgi:hypothetical protein